MYLHKGCAIFLAGDYRRSRGIVLTGVQLERHFKWNTDSRWKPSPTLDGIITVDTSVQFDNFMSRFTLLNCKMRVANSLDLLIFESLVWLRWDSNPQIPVRMATPKVAVFASFTTEPYQ